MIILSVDPSLQSSGWALFDHNNLLGVGYLKTRFEPLAPRLVSLQRRVESLLKSCRIDHNALVICEDATTMRNPQTAMKIEQVRGIFECAARSMGATVPGRINPRTVQSTLLGMRGAQVKREYVKAAIVEVVKHHYSDQLEQLSFPSTAQELRRHQDICDAILIGHMARLKIIEANRLGVPLWEVFETRRARILKKRK
jgi:Holliday junction resolvasome RuvABC endonuclease subunit